MIPENAIREIDFPQEDLDTCNTTHFIRLFTEISQTPWKSKNLKGKIVLGFPTYNDDPRPNYAIPEIRKFVQALDASFPFLPYFLFPEPATSHILFYLQCLIEFDSRYSFSSQELIAMAQKKMSEVKRFCDKIADEPHSVAERIILNMPPEILREAFPEFAVKALRSMKSFFRSLLEQKLGQRHVEYPPELKPEYRFAFENEKYVQAEKLSGLQRAGYASDVEFLQALLHKIEQQSSI